MRVIIKLNEISDQALTIIGGVQQLGHEAWVITTCEDPQVLTRLRQTLAQTTPAIPFFWLPKRTALTEPQNAIRLQGFLLSLRPDLFVTVVSDLDTTVTEADALPELGDPSLQSLLGSLPSVVCRDGEVDRSDNSEFVLPHALKEALSGANSKSESSCSESNGSASGPCSDRLKLAMVGPTVPSKSGIAVYTDELVSALSEFYEITLVDTTPPSLREETPSNTPPDLAWFAEHSGEFDRVVYQVGNSAYHAGMLATLKKIPGVAVLHDFFLGHLRWWEYANGYHPARKRELCREHGLKAVIEDKDNDAATAILYPFNNGVFADSLGVIVHSKHAQELIAARQTADNREQVSLVPLLRNGALQVSRESARQALGLAQDDFIVCTFGGVSPLKLHHAILTAWADSSLAQDVKCKLIVVGDKGDPKYMQQIQAILERLPFPGNVEVTGFTSPETFRHYLDAADMAIQLRTQSRGETSAAVLDCMNHGLPTIVNAHGSMAELDEEAVFKLRDNFTNADLVRALETLWGDAGSRARLAERSKSIIQSLHTPAHCASRYHEIIEASYAEKSPSGSLAQVQDALEGTGLTTEQSIALIDEILDQKALKTRNLFLDMTDVVTSARRSGIERTAAQLCASLIKVAPENLSVVPVYLVQTETGWCHFAANRFMASELSKTTPWQEDAPIEPLGGDVVMTLDLTAHPIVQAKRNGLFDRYQARGVKLASLVYDLLPIRMPEVFPPNAGEYHAQWLEVVASFDGAACISNHVAQDLQRWLQENNLSKPSFKVGAIRLGSETGIFDGWGRSNAELFGRAALTLLEHDTSFLMVGTIEPRKGYFETLEAFSHLWKHGFACNLILVGREGWQGLPEEQRRDIPETITAILQHPELGKRLHWLNDANDPELENIYKLADCLIAASFDEGFGLPLVEAARHRLPVLARDIDVFREVAPEATRFFKASDSLALAEAIKSTIWDPIPRPTTAPQTTSWAQTACELIHWLRDKGLLQG